MSSKQNQFRDWLLDWSYCLPECAMHELESIFGDYIVPASAPETGRDDKKDRCTCPRGQTSYACPVCGPKHRRRGDVPPDHEFDESGKCKWCPEQRIP